MRGSLGLEVVGDLRPGADAHAIGLRDAAVLQQGPRRRLLVGPHALLERPAKLGVVRLADQVVALVVEGGVEEEAVVLDLEVLLLLADPALAQGDELLPLGQGAHRYGPLFERDWHKNCSGERLSDLSWTQVHGCPPGRIPLVRVRKPRKSAEKALVRRDILRFVRTISNI